jgi:hypothetical protein
MFVDLLPGILPKVVVGEEAPLSIDLWLNPSAPSPALPEEFGILYWDGVEILPVNSDCLSPNRIDAPFLLEPLA